VNKLTFALLFSFALTIPLGYAVPAFAITLTQISTVFPSPIGIDHHEEGVTDKVAISVNYPTGNPHALKLVAADGSQAQFSALSGVGDEVKIATVRSGNTGGFTAGDLFVGNGVDGQVVRVSNNGATITNPWADLPGAGNGLMRGSLYVDRTGIYGDELIVVTTTGEVWRINSAGVGTLIADVNVHLEGVVTVPNNAAQYGPLAGKIIAGAEGVGLLYAFDNSGFDATYDVDVNIEDIDHITGTENFYGVNFGTGRLLGAPAADFAPYAGEILLTQETFAGGTSGLFHLFWNGVSLQALPIPATVTTGVIGQWEHVTFSTAGIVEIPPVNDEVIGGEIIPINTAALLVAGAQSTSVWMISVLGLAAGLGLIFLRKKRF
jgi:hypothetical protein